MLESAANLSSASTHSEADLLLDTDSVIWRLQSVPALQLLGEAWSTVSNSGLLSKDTHGLTGHQQGATKMVKELEYVSCEEKLRELGPFRLEMRRLKGISLMSIST